jgi:hypothetical protein
LKTSITSSTTPGGSAFATRRTVNAIRAQGPEGFAVVLQGKLLAGDVLAEAGLSAQLKGGPRLAVPEPAHAQAIGEAAA